MDSLFEKSLHGLCQAMLQCGAARWRESDLHTVLPVKMQPKERSADYLCRLLAVLDRKPLRARIMDRIRTLVPRKQPAAPFGGRPKPTG